MSKPKQQPEQRTRRHWETVADSELLDVELSTDDPEGLDGVVYELPPGDGEPYVEFKYDLRGSDRDPWFRCVHGNHPHLAGYVMRKGPHRFLVGHICGEKIYGETFEHYTSDFDAAVNRKDALQRTRAIRNAVEPCMRWLQEVMQSELFKHFNRIRGEFRTQMPWVYENAERMAAVDIRVTRVEVPKAIFNDKADPRADFARIVSDFSTIALRLTNPEEALKQLPGLKTHLDLFIRRVERVLDELAQVEAVFQPAVVKLLRDLANEYDNPRKRTYEPGLMSITCKRDKTKWTIQIPNGFRLPDRAPIAALRLALAVS